MIRCSPSPTLTGDEELEVEDELAEEYLAEVAAEETNRDFTDNINPDSLEVLQGCKLEPSLAEAGVGVGYQFMRNGYFCVDMVESKPGRLVFNRTISLVDTWAKMQK